MALSSRVFIAEANRRVGSACTVGRDTQCKVELLAGTLPRRQSRASADHIGTARAKLSQTAKVWPIAAVHTARAGLAMMAVTARLGPARNLKGQCAAFLVPNTDGFFHFG
jgi:hypothetical protein